MALAIDRSTAPATRALAAFSARLQFEDLPADVVQRTKDLFLDFLGVALRGATTDSGITMARVAAELSAEGPASVIGFAQSAAAQYAALVNGTSSHSIEMDDVTTISSLHPGVAAFPTVLALAEEIDAAPRDVIAAAVAGYEVIMRVGEAINGSEAYKVGFHPTAVAGVFGAAAASASLLKLDEERTAHALGIAGSMAAGSMEYLTDGAWTKRLHPGWAAHSGILAAKMARAGYVGPTTILEGPHGFLTGYTRTASPERLTDGLGEQFKLLETNIKVHACCRYMHGPIDCVLRLGAQHDLEPQQIQSIVCFVLTGGRSLVADPLADKQNPTNTVDAQFSMPFGAAVAVVKRSAGLDAFAQEVVDDPAVRALLPKITCESDPSLDALFPARWPARVVIRLTDGRDLRHEILDPRGSESEPLGWDDLAAKFTELTSPIVDESRRDAIIEGVDALDRATSLRPLGRLLRSVPG
ncbi:MAG: MmgE/PrpD family protein [Chloroflexota bacterium]